MLTRLFLKIAVLAGLFAGLAAPLPALAVGDPNPLNNIDCSSNNAGESAVCGDRSGDDPLTGPNGVIVRATNILAFIAGIAAVIFMIVGGIKYITAAGNPGDVQKAKETVIFAIVGLIAIVLARSVITFILTRV